MNEDPRITKVEVLFHQKRYAEAEKILMDLLASDASNTHLLLLLSEVNLAQDKYAAARQYINNAIGLDPSQPYPYSVKSRIAIQEDKLAEAEESISQAIGLYPYDASFFALQANIRLARKQFREALEISDQALAIDPENLLALNTRSTALNKLNRKDESFETIEGALREDPNNAYTHANYGWGLLEKGNHKKAKEHFSESLKNDPTYEYAQSGMLVAIKATNPLYRLFLKYAFWMNNLTARYQWGVIIGLYLGIRLLNILAKSNPTLGLYLTPLIVTLTIFAFSTWVISPVSNLFLRFNKYGQLLLSKKEKMSSNFVATGFIFFLIGILCSLGLSDERFLSITVFGFSMMLPCSIMFAASRYKNALLIYTIALAVTGILAILVTFLTGALFNLFSMIYLFGFIAFQWVANFLIIKKSNR